NVPPSGSGNGAPAGPPSGSGARSTSSADDGGSGQRYDLGDGGTTSAGGSDTERPRGPGQAERLQHLVRVPLGDVRVGAQGHHGRGEHRGHHLTGQPGVPARLVEELLDDP